MGSAESGGNQPQRVLLIGGPKHGEFICLPAADDEYKFVSDKMLMPRDGNGWHNYPSTAEHVYKRDEKLERVIWSGPSPTPPNIFTHQVLWESPVHGGFNLYALGDALKALEAAEAAVKAADERLQEKQQIVSDRNREIGDLQCDLLASQDLLLERNEQIHKIRVFLEVMGINLIQAVGATGIDYSPQYKLPQEAS